MVSTKVIIWVSVAAAVLSLIMAALHVPTPIRATFAFLLLACLAYVWTQVLFRDRIPAVEAAVVGATLTIALPVIGGVAMDKAGIRLDTASWSVLFAAADLLGAFLLFRQWQQGSGSVEQIRVKQRGVPRAPDGRRAFSRGQVAACSIAAVITAGAIGLAVQGASTQKYPGYTQLWLDGKGGATTNNGILGVANRDGKNETYRLEILRSGKLLSSSTLSLEPGKTWQHSLNNDKGIRVNLYLLPNLKTPYRFVDSAS
jgi:uncharacterized membrane protein